MRNSYYTKSNNSKIVFYAVLLAILAGICFVVIQDITVPTSHISQTIEVNIKK